MTQSERRRSVREQEADTRALVLDRDGNQCVVCGTPRSLSLQHVLPRGMGGSATGVPAHLAITLCGDGNRGCHGATEHAGREQGWAYTLGYLVRHGPRPAGDDDSHLVWVHHERAWFELFPSGVRTRRPDVIAPDPVILAGLPPVVGR